MIASLSAGIVAWILSAYRNLQIPTLSPNLEDCNTDWSNIASGLGPRLSPNASIYFPSSDGFKLAAYRWQAWSSPIIDVVVQVVTESDVEQVVRYANEIGKPFLAMSGGHGGISTLKRAEGVLGISMRAMNWVDVKENGDTARIGGGVLSGELLSGVWEHGKEAVVGTCECTGAVSPMLGGGHGWLQGHYGLMADNLASARLVLANGTTVTVSSVDNPDLFWAIRGAGHNFGIVTEFEYKIHDRKLEDEALAYELMMFKGEQLEEVYEVANSMIGGNVNPQPVGLAHWTMIMRNAEIDPVDPIIVFYILYQGSSSIPATYSQKLRKLNPVFIQSDVTTVQGFAKIAGIDMDGPFCQTGISVQRHPVSLFTYPIEGMRESYNLIASLPTPLKELSIIITEAYSLPGVQAVDSDSTAYPDREGNLLISDMIIYPPSDSDLDNLAHAQGSKIQSLLTNASGRALNAYVNYASGVESLEAIYGYEDWRLEKLRKLKMEYDPTGRFGYYAPIF